MGNIGDLVMQPTNSFVSVLVAADLIVFSFYLSTGIEKHLCVYVYVCVRVVCARVYMTTMFIPPVLYYLTFTWFSPPHTLSHSYTHSFLFLFNETTVQKCLTQGKPTSPRNSKSQRDTRRREKGAAENTNQYSECISEVYLRLRHATTDVHMSKFLFCKRYGL